MLPNPDSNDFLGNATFIVEIVEGLASRLSHCSYVHNR
jgi:hypothetical protein